MLNETFNPNSSALVAKIQRHMDLLKAQASQELWATQDEFYTGLTRSLWDIFTNLRSLYVASISVNYLDRLYPMLLSNFTQFMTWDLQDTYLTLEETQSEFLRRINRYLAAYRALDSKLSKANNIVGSISRNNEDQTYEISDTFNSTVLLDTGATDLTINESAGMVTLPITAFTPANIRGIVILPNSNGDGSDISKLYDGNGDTFFVYQRSAMDDEPLICEFQITLQNSSVINQIELDAVTIDDKAFTKVVDIQTSLDGKSYRTIKDSLPANLSANEADQMFTLGPVGLRNQKTAQFIFEPRAAQYIKIKLTQGKKTDSTLGPIQRFALSEIRVGSQQYKDSGTLVTRQLRLPFIPRRLYLIEQATETSPLTALDWEISLDNGSTWSTIKPGQPLEVNTGSQNSISIPTESNYVAVRLSARRLKDRFTGIAKPLAAVVRRIVQRIQATQPPMNITLENIPIDGSLEVLVPTLAIGQNYGFDVSAGTGVNVSIDFPDIIKPFTETVKVNGTAWTRVKSISVLKPDERGYEIDYTNGKIKFGDNKTGFAPDGAITLEIEPERLLLPDTSPFLVKLLHNHDYNEDNTKIYWYDRPRRIISESLAKGANKFQLASYPVLQHLDVVEDVPEGSTSFYLHNIPFDPSLLEFSDQTIFSTLVSGIPVNPGEYSVTQLKSSAALNPVLIQTYEPTNTRDAGIVTFVAQATILDPQSDYSKDSWTKAIQISGLDGMMNIYRPIFNDDIVFADQKIFKDGKTELTKAGDFSIDLLNGIIYTFTSSSQSSVTSISYFYQKIKELTWSFTENPDELLINDESFLVSKNDQDIVILNFTGQKYRVVYKDNRWIFVPLNAISPYSDNGVTFEFDSNDYLRGYELPAAKNVIKLNHEALVKNSVRFLFLSDDINAYDDRIVTKSGTNISISPKPVKDVYGNLLGDAPAGSITQRDVDRQILITERPFVDGYTELIQGGDFSVDYENGILYTYTPVPAHTIIQYEFADVRASYIATKRLQRDTNFVFNIDKLQIEVRSINNSNSSSELFVKYDVVDQLKEDPSKIYTYYSPLLMGYTLRAKK